MKSIAVFCGSRFGNNPVYEVYAKEVGTYLANAGIQLVYGGAKVGIMGTIADATLAAGEEVIGVMPKSLEEKEISHEGLTELHIVESMHERKKMMMDLADGFIVFPGGIGTMEEFFEVFTWNMMGILHKPCALLNVAGYYEGLIQMLKHMVDEGFLQQQTNQTLIVEETVEAVVEKMVEQSATLK